MKNLFSLFVLLLFTANSFAQETEIKKLDINLDNYEYPHPVNYLSVNNQGEDLRMAYMDINTSNSSGKNVLLLHGKNFNAAYWETTVKALSDAGFRVIVPDQIGFGKSDKPQNFQYSFQQLAFNTKTLLDTLGIDSIAVLGHSMGGMLATRFALMYPEITEKLILENPIGLEDYKLVVPYKPVNWWYQNELEQDYESIKKYQKENYYNGEWNEEYELWARLLAGWTLNEEYDQIAMVSALIYDMILTQPVLYEFKYLRCPILLIIGTRDRTAVGKNLIEDKTKREELGRFNLLGRGAVERFQNAQLVEIEDTGHLPHIERFEEFIEPLLLFLEKE